MNPVLKPYDDVELSGCLEEDVSLFLTRHQRPITAEHSIRVGKKARELAIRFGADADQAEAAGYLHDVSAIFPNDERIEVSRQLGIEVLPEEEKFPMIIHQKISRVMARELFRITAEPILSAVECHTTLKKSSSLLDRIVFVADKIEWDQSGTPPYLDHLLKQLDRSPSHAALVYLEFLWDRRDTLKVLHPWAEAAYKELLAELD
ncbi:bis(5'-nucleosyl)-tetraphosphatase (symmetrical) YqeK [Paenibacillus sp. J2TS4]|uniref:bis(5'-nucleosyl)-tetraphosphatase (symmetrical) YqeK n=1 Tax=Paenibacillus sp. J2TS4 TaxID=2807194 RepID=UPI001B259271|nr:bis(5'-nucleosyl)-tetraphosphatase (symmetrical) YqeK [Paenibacillus sp. J2TS4]GIP32698.1 haloacid dehalogenase [Paenibacillus sp. J2TS4]